jgi:hypothetical protein
MTAKTLLLAVIDEAYNVQAWHGSNPRGSLRGVKESEAEWRPAPGRHSIRDITVHAAFWKFRIRRRLSGDEAATFVLPGKDWFPPEATRTWAKDLKLLGSEHVALRAAVEAFPERRLNRALLSNGMTAAYLIRGIAAHDLYHAGQIQLLKRLQRMR